MGSISSEAALQRLLEGNQRFIQENLHEIRLGARLREVAQAQFPFAAILGCSDSRVPAELVFDCSLGDLFVVRTAGHVLGPPAIGSLEYAAVYLRVPLIMVLGHARCGAIQAALSAARGSTARGSIAALLEGVRPAVERARTLTGDPLDRAVVGHVEDTVAALRCAELLAPLVETGKLRVVGARYDLDTGLVQLLA